MFLLSQGEALPSWMDKAFNLGGVFVLFLLFLWGAWKLANRFADKNEKFMDRTAESGEKTADAVVHISRAQDKSNEILDKLNATQNEGFVNLDQRMSDNERKTKRIADSLLYVIEAGKELAPDEKTAVLTHLESAKRSLSG